MKIIAKTNDGYLISASGNELKEILTSVSGVRPKEKELEIGQKIQIVSDIKHGTRHIINYRVKNEG